MTKSASVEKSSIETSSNSGTHGRRRARHLNLAEVREDILEDVSAVPRRNLDEEREHGDPLRSVRGGKDKVHLALVVLQIFRRVRNRRQRGEIQSRSDGNGPRRCSDGV